MFGTVLLTWAVLLGLDVVLAVCSASSSDIGKGDYGFAQALTYVLYTVPRRAYTLFPTAAVIGALMGAGPAGGEFGTDRAARAGPVAAPAQPRGGAARWRC